MAVNPVFEHALRGFRPYLILTVLCALVFLPGLDTLPPMDRDESRYVQATTQMLETGDFIHIRYQDVPRNKKPIGIYWLQAASVSLFGDVEARTIWAYRLPSVLSAFGTVIVTFMLGSFLFGRAAGLVAATVLATTVMVTTEAHLGKTDATLMFFTAVAMACLARVYMGSRPDFIGPHSSRRFFWLGWGAMGCAILIKGPLGPMVALLATVTLTLVDRSVGWLKSLKFGPGLLLSIVIAAPWFVLITLSDQGSGFLSDAVGKDLLPKLLAGQESHGAPPGYYLLLISATFWPGSLILWPALWLAIRNWRLPSVRFCLAWIIPAWIVFEIVPTKLPHYTMILYPALALLCGAAVVRFGEAFQRILSSKIMWPLIAFWAVLGLALSGAAGVLPFVYGGGFAFDAIIGGILCLALVVLTLIALFRHQHARAALLGVGGAIAIFGTVFTATMPNLVDLWMAPRAKLAVLEHQGHINTPVAVTHYHEPSLVYLLGTETNLTDASGAAGWLIDHPDRLALVSLDHEADFLGHLAQAGKQAESLEEIAGLNYSRGDEMTLKLYRLVEAP